MLIFFLMLLSFIVSAIFYKCYILRDNHKNDVSCCSAQDNAANLEEGNTRPLSAGPDLSWAYAKLPGE